MNQKLSLETATYVFDAPVLGEIDELIRHNCSRQGRFVRMLVPLICEQQFWITSLLNAHSFSAATNIASQAWTKPTQTIN